MKLFAHTIALVIATTAAAHAEDSRIDGLCGAGHQNEAAAADVRSNPTGYFVAALGEQVPSDDPRIIRTNAEDAPYLCTRSAATPAMDATQAALAESKRAVKWLFVPMTD